jgi:4-amino-4-deoxy-L-arabinose transferase-like glycosyltransferase
MPVAAIAMGVVALLLLVATRYGWHRDELYFLACGRHLAWGYVDQPPFVPLVARAADLIAPGNLVVLRLLPALAAAVTIAAGSVIAGELGGGRAGRIAGAAVVAAGGFVLGVGHLLSTAVFDLTAWMVLLAIGCRVLRTSDPRWWVPFGGVAGLALLNKNLVVLLCASLAVGLVVERRWRLLAPPWMVAGLALAVAIAAPHLRWQAQHGWPQIDMARALAARLATENRVTLLPFQVLFAGPAFVLIGWRGVRWLAADERARPFRPLLWAWPVGLVAGAVTGGRP